MEGEKRSDFSSPFKITCKKYPSEFNLDKNIAKEYFRQFGGLKRVIFKPKLGICTVEYSTKEGFLKAFNNAGDYNGRIFEISIDEGNEIEKKKVSEFSKPVWLDDNEVETELKAMSAVGGDKTVFTSDDVSMMLAVKSGKRKKTRVWDLEATVKKKVKAKESHKEPIKMVSLSEEHLSLINVVLSQSHTIEDKFKVLDARDKLLRSKLKHYNIKRGATLGACPDMCPEKERILRVIQHQVSIYEQDSGKTMDRKKAIKQYSRSSADQEAPLSHELRPVPILQMTMCYLMHNIMDLIDTPDVNISEWYHFLWDRTRSIRKDITQQELCCQGAVKLVEQCARFHIHCSARLIGEEPSVFDQKINTENLTKCLQTLKYMYHDLELKNEYCPNEPEFRAYVILLNLNDGNFMWEVQQLRQEIQKSPEVKFALAVYSALDKNNYVKFFKLVNSTTYLNACILMRYFVQIRATALKYHVKCYAPRATKILFPLNELSKILSFDDTESVIDFVQFYGLPLNEQKSHVILDKSTFALPEIPYVLERSLNVVESKRFHSVGRVVCGEDLPPRSFESHVPQNSFDSKGYLISKDFLETADLEKASKQLNDELVKSDEVDSTNNKQIAFREDTKSPMLAMNEPIKSISDQAPTIFNTNKETYNIFQVPFAPNYTSKSIFDNTALEIVESSPFKKIDEGSFRAELNTKFTPTKSIFGLPQDIRFCSTPQSIFGASMPDVPIEIPKASEAPKGGLSINLIQPNKPLDIQVSINSISNQNVLTLKESSFMPQYFFKPETDLQKKNYNIGILDEAHNMLEDELEDESKIEELDDTEFGKRTPNMDVPKISKQINEILEMDTKKFNAEKEISERLKKQDMLKNKEIESDVRDVLHSVVRLVHKKIQEEKLILHEKQLRDETMLKVIQIWRRFVLNTRKRKAMDCTPVWMNTSTLKEVARELHTPSQNLTLSLKTRYKLGKPLDIEIQEDEEITKINLLDLTYTTMKNRYFKLTGTIQKLIYWKIVISIPDEQELNEAQRIEHTMEKAFQWKNKQHMIEQVKLNNFECVTYCIEKQKGLAVQETNANGIVFIAKNFNTNLQRRIFEHLKEFGVFTKVPVVIILQEYDKNECKLKALQDAKILSHYIILISDLSPYDLLNSVEEGLVFLASNIEISPPLELDTFYSFIKQYLCSEIWKKANSFAKWNSNYKMCLRNPNIVISLYNEALQKLTKIILDSRTKEFAKFPEVFKNYLVSQVPNYLPCNYQYFPSFWRTDYYLYKLQKILKELSLPKWQEKWPPSTEFELEINIAKYCTKAFKNPEITFYKTMALLLQGIDPNINFIDMGNILWTNVIELLGLEKLRQINLGLNGTDFENKSSFNQYIVVYNKDEITEYSKSDWLYVNNSLIGKKIKQFLHLEKTMTTPEKISSVSSDDINKTIEEVTKKLNRSPMHAKKLQKEINEFNVLLNDLETSISIQKKINSRMEQHLKQAIADY